MRALQLLVVFLFAAACVDVPGTSSGPGPTEDGGGTSPDGGAFDAGPPPTDREAPTISITAPSNGATFGSGVSTLTVSGTARDDVGVAAVHVAVGPNAFVPAATQDFHRNWQATLSLPPGTFAVRARATDVAGKSAETQITVARTPARTDTAAPSLTILAPADGTRTTRAGVIVVGTASDDTGLAKVETRVDGLTAFVLAETSDTFANWRASVGLAPGTENVIRARATDLAGRTVEQTIRVTSITAADREPPVLTITSPAPGATLSTETVTVTGTARDNVAVAKVEVRVGTGSYIGAASSDGYATWSATVPLAPGANTLRVRATDVSELETIVSINVTSTFTPVWGAPANYELRLPAPRDRNVVLDLDRTGLGEVIPEATRRSIVLLRLDPTVLMRQTMDAIKTSCGGTSLVGCAGADVPRWKTRDFSPTCPGSWQAPEVNLWRLLTMTPDNVNVAGTSVAGVKDIADTLSGWGLIDSFSDILAQTLAIHRCGEIVDTNTAVAALLDDLIKTHPNANSDGTLPITIQDGFTDMRELSNKFGPQGAHPGFLDPAFPTFSQVLLGTFRMSVRGVSNLTWYDGVDLSMGKEYIALLPTPTTDVISFDFANTMSVTGLAANPTVNLTLVVNEHPSFLPAYTPPGDRDASNAATPPPHPGIGAAWSVSKWLVEYVLVDAAFRKYRTRTDYLLYEEPIFGIDEAAIAVGMNDGKHFPNITNTSGWARFWTLFGLGSPPKAQYLWEMIAEISQVRLRDGNVPEGQGRARFTLSGLSVGLTGSQIISQMRPSLEAQKSVLAQRLLGDYRRNNGAVDFYLKGVSGDLYLFFIHASDPRPSDAYNYARPGFFSDAALTQKVSSTAAQTSGDSVHEKIRLTGTGQTVYAQDNEGGVYRIEVSPAATSSVTLRVSKKL